MFVSRRGFLGGLSATCAAIPFARAEEATFKVGILSDTHITTNPATAEPLFKCLRRFANEGVRVVVISGDLCELGTLDELRLLRATWDRAFPNGLNARGKKVDPFPVWGNHDYHDASYMRGKAVSEEDQRKGIVYNKDAAWRLMTGEEKHPGEIFLRAFDGFTFIGAHWNAQDGLGEFLAAHAAEIPKNRPVFYVQHPHPRGTCFRGRSGGDAGKSRDALLNWPNVFAISGHSHTSVSFDDDLWCGGFVSMGAGSTRLVNGRRYEYNVRRKSAKAPPPEIHMSPCAFGRASQSSVLSVYPTRVTVDRWEHFNDEPLGETWSLDFPFVHDAAHPFRIADAALPPEFPAGAEISVRIRDGKTYPSQTPERQVWLQFPAARSNGPHARVIDYRVRVTREKTGELVLERLVAQEGTAMAECRACARPGCCVFSVSELPAGVPLTFAVEPLNAGAKGGKSIKKGFTV